MENAKNLGDKNAKGKNLSPIKSASTNKQNAKSNTARKIKRKKFSGGASAKTKNVNVAKKDETNSNAKKLETHNQAQASKKQINPLNIKLEKEKQAEISGSTEINFDAKKFGNRNIIAIFLAFVVSIFMAGSIIVAGNFKQSPQMLADVTNTRIVQARLANLGYYDDVIDGIYDAKTIQAVKNYQADENLQVTGNLDESTTTALGVTDNAQANSDLYLLAKLIYSEARGEVYEGQVAVGAVVLNRVSDAGFPNTLQGVIYQPWAFTALHDGQFSLEPNSTAYQAAQDAMNGWDPTYGCLYYYNPATATSSWIFSRKIAVTIGNHVFCY